VGILAFSFISLRSKDYMQATSLSGMTQGFGYLIGACGPILFGLLFDLTQSWNLILLIIAALGIIQSYFGLKAGRNITLH
jgi:Cyanate permease